MPVEFQEDPYPRPGAEPEPVTDLARASAPELAAFLRSERKDEFESKLDRHGEDDAFPAEARRRLEREPIIRDAAYRSDAVVEPSSSASLSIHDISRYLMGRPYLSPGMSSQRLPFDHRLALRIASDELEIDPAAKKQVLRILKRDEYLCQKTRTLLHLSAGPYERYLEHWRDYGDDIVGSLGHAVEWTRSGPLEERISQGRQLARLLIGRTVEICAAWRSTAPQLYATEPNGAPGVVAEPDFERMLRPLESLPNLTAFIESRPFVRRHYDCEMPERWTIATLVHVKYDFSRVRELELTDDRGRSVMLISKRLNPMKSAMAEEEFEMSKFLYAAGVPTPQPVGVLSHGRNTWFLWKKVDAVTEVPAEAKPEVDRQIDVIMQQLEALGVEHDDLAARNILISRQRGKWKVTIIDCERMRRR